MTGTNNKELMMIALANAQVTYLLERVLRASGFDVVVFEDAGSVQRALAGNNLPAMLLLGEHLKDTPGLTLGESVLRQYPGLPVVLYANEERVDTLHAAMRLGISDVLTPPLRSDDITRVVQNCLDRARQKREWILLEARRATASLQKRLDELETMTRLGRSITASLDLDSVLVAVVDAAVELTGAEEGSLLLVDAATGELYMRAARNFQEDFVRKFRLPIQDTLAGTVLRTGQPVILDEKTPQKIKTSYLVHSLAYVPLILHEQVFGVLGVDNRLDRTVLREHDLRVLTLLADYAVIAIENARLYTTSIQERNKLDTILTNIQDGVIVIDSDQRVVFANQVVQDAFGLAGQTVSGQRFAEVFSANNELLEMAAPDGVGHERAEISVPDGRIFNGLSSSISAVGQAITLHDITNLKKLDRIKSDFVSAVSHDLRSPLTAILGYVELLEKVGPVNDTQREFIHRVQASVHNITNLVNDLLNLGRIEAGLDARREEVQPTELLRLSVTAYFKPAEDKNIALLMEIPEKLPGIQANPVQMRQVVENLLDNAIKYTLPGGKVTLRAGVTQDQLIIQVLDSGIGIPPVDLPYIFDKFYRASNCTSDTSGTGLGLAIVKSIVESHRGRIWVESVQGTGTTFTVVLPMSI